MFFVVLVIRQIWGYRDNIGVRIIHVFCFLDGPNGAKVHHRTCHVSSFFLFSTVSLPHQRPSTWNVEKAQIDGWMKCCCVVDRLFSPGRISKLIFWSNGFTSSDEFYGDIQGDLLCLSWVAAGQLYQATWWIFPNWPSLRNSRLVRYWNRTHKWMSVCMCRYIVVVIYIYTFV